jgi:hypothetical protein
VRSGDPTRLPSTPVVGYAVATTLVTSFASGLAALHVLRNIQPNPVVISNINSEIRCFLAKMVSVVWEGAAVGLGVGCCAQISCHLPCACGCVGWLCTGANTIWDVCERPG